MSVGDAGQNRFPSVLLQPLGHLSVSLESAVYGPVAEPKDPNCDRPLNLLRSLTGVRPSADAPWTRFQYKPLHRERESRDPLKSGSAVAGLLGSGAVPSCAKRCTLSSVKEPDALGLQGSALARTGQGLLEFRFHLGGSSFDDVANIGRRLPSGIDQHRVHTEILVVISNKVDHCASLGKRTHGG